MEELRSTETLDREILEDARKKAQRILKTADDTLSGQTREWEKKTREAVDSVREVYGERTRKSGEEILARLPLDKRRLRAETSESLLVKAMDDFLRSLGRETLLSVLKRELRKRLEYCAGEEVSSREETSRPSVIYSALTPGEARAVIEKALAALPEKTGLLSTNAFTGSAADWDFKEDTNGREFPAIVIDTRAIKISASIESAAASLLKDRRAELAAALLGEGVLDD